MPVNGAFARAEAARFVQVEDEHRRRVDRHGAVVSDALGGALVSENRHATTLAALLAQTIQW